MEKQRELLIKKMIITIHNVYHKEPSGGETKTQAQARYAKMLHILNGICLSASDDCPVLDSAIEMADSVEEMNFLDDQVRQQKFSEHLTRMFNWAIGGKNG